MDEPIDSNAPATKGDVIDLKNELLEAFRDGQTELLKAFYNYAESTDIKLRESQAADGTLRERLSVVERRLTEVEKRLNMPPAA